MVRKVGFDRKDTEAKKSIADSYLDEFRKKHNHELSPAPDAPPEKRRNWIVIVFLCIWLFFWSFGILMVLGILLSGEGVTFLYVWLTAAVLGWFLAVFILIKQIKGVPVKSKHRE